MLPVLLLALAQLPVEISVFVDVAPVEDDCALKVRVPAALARALPGIPILLERARERDVPPGRLRLVLRPDASLETVQLELFDRPRAKVMDRVIPARANACAATADGIALIVERYLRDLGYEPSPAPLPIAAPTPAPARTATTAASSRAARTPPRSESEISLDVGARAQGQLGLDPSRGTASLALLPLRLEIDRGLEVLVALGTDVPFTTHQPVSSAGGRISGRIDVSSAFLLGGVGYCFHFDAPRVCFDISAGVERYSGSQVNLFQPRPAQVIWTFVAAPEARLDLEILRPFSLFGAVGARVRGAPPSFTVQDATPTYDVPAFALTLSFGVWARIL